MKILLASYYAEAHLPSSAAQNIRFLAESFVGLGHEVRVLCGAVSAGEEDIDGYRLIKLPLASSDWNVKWLGAWRPDPRVREMAHRELKAWRPDVVLVGAWRFLTELALEARHQGIPVVQVVHDYSILCLRQWLLDSSDSLCSGPTSPAKCQRCLRDSLDPRTELRTRLLSLPLAARIADALRSSGYVHNRHVPVAAQDALDHMASYRQAITLFIAQAPSVVEILGSAAITPSRCRFLPQFIGEDKLTQYSRSERSPGRERPLRFVYVGRWSPEKGSDLLYQAFQTADLKLDVELRILARNVEASELESASAPGKDRFRRVRVITDAEGGEVSRHLAQCDVCVVPSTCQELASRVVLEANAQGVPVIASSTVGNRYLIEDGVNGRIFASGNVEALRCCLEDIAADPSVLQEWSRHVAKPVGREEWIRLATEILQEAVSLRPSP